MLRKYVTFVCPTIIMMMVGQVLAQDLPDAETLKTRCENENAVQLVNEITRRNEHQDWYNIAEKVAVGDEAWIAASGCLMLGTKGSISAIDWLILKMAWADALPKNPAAMLEIEYQGYSLGDLCELPHIEPEEEYLAHYVEETIAALEKVDAGHLEGGKRRCISLMKAAYERCRFIEGVGYCYGSLVEAPQ